MSFMSLEDAAKQGQSEALARLFRDRSQYASHFATTPELKAYLDAGAKTIDRAIAAAREVCEGGETTRVKDADLRAMQECLAAARRLVQHVRATGACPGDLTPLVARLSEASGMGPLWDPMAQADAEYERTKGGA